MSWNATRYQEVYNRAKVMDELGKDLDCSCSQACYCYACHGYNWYEEPCDDVLCRECYGPSVKDIMFSFLGGMLYKLEVKSGNSLMFDQFYR